MNTQPNNTSMFDALTQILSVDQYTVSESFKLPSRLVRSKPIPRFLFDSRIGLFLHKNDFGKNGLWNHQAIALQKLANGQNVVISTGTASGKSLIFRTAVFHHHLLNKDDRILVFYPLKALAADQLKGWRAMADDLGIPQNVVGRIDGSVDYKMRDEILEHCRIVIMTPDVCHAWMMSRLSMPVVKMFIKRLAFIVMDEAHTLEGVFGSNFAFLLRRLFTARQELQGSEEYQPLRLIGSTATISNPAEHMETITGVPFEAVTEEMDGSPQYERICAHVICPAGEELAIAKSIMVDLLTESHAGGFITFVDSRKGVEMLARKSRRELSKLLGDEAIMPYRAGYSNHDREAIERRLQSGNLRGVISTSALELGIDLPHLAVGINIGVPATRKAYRQRLGRVGRAGNGAFLIIAPANAFRAYGTSFKEYHDMSVEPSYLYLDNRFMQFAHARCLADELEALGIGSSLPSHGTWPDGFKQVYDAARYGGDRPREFDAMAQLGGDSPQYNYPLRNVGELNFQIKKGENADAIGEANEAQALRECYPGGVYLHLVRAYEVQSWYSNTNPPFIKVRATPPGRHTKPRITTWINTGTTPDDLLDQHLLTAPNGFLAESQMQVTERVEGFIDQDGTFHSYTELRQRNPNMRPRTRNFRTSGVLLCIEDAWFREKGVKQRLSDWITEIFCREYSILPQDVGNAATNISVRTSDASGHRGDCLVLFDQTYGSLRLTERLFIDFRLILQRMRVSAESAEKDERGDLIRYVGLLEDAFSEFQPAQEAVTDPTIETPPPSCMRVFTSGSRVCYRERGKIGTEVEILQPTWMNDQLMYLIQETPKRMGDKPPKRWVSGDHLEPSADSSAWDYAWWDANTQEFVDFQMEQNED